MDHVKTFTQAYTQAPWRKQLQILGLFLLGLIFAALVAGIYLNVTARAATTGREILMMQDEIETLQLTNADLETRLALVTSSASMKNRALSMGFTPIDAAEVTYMVVPGYTGREQAVLAPPPDPVVTVAASLPRDYTESLFDWLKVNVLPSVKQWFEVQP